MSMNTATKPDALYYPFHLCHERTLQHMLERYASIHFRDYMALQLTSMTGMTAYANRMGDTYPDLVQSGRIVQGYSVSGPLRSTLVAAIDRDLADRAWRSLFHQALSEDRRFQRGLFDLSHSMLIGGTMVPGPAALLCLIQDFRRDRPYSVDSVRSLSRKRDGLETAYEFEYGLALINTAASLAYTSALALTHGLEAMTDSAFHHRLLSRTCTRDDISLRNHVVERQGY